MAMIVVIIMIMIMMIIMEKIKIQEHVSLIVYIVMKTLYALNAMKVIFLVITVKVYMNVLRLRDVKISQKHV